jgi:hypothetical protein
LLLVVWRCRARPWARLRAAKRGHFLTLSGPNCGDELSLRCAYGGGRAQPPSRGHGGPDRSPEEPTRRTARIPRLASTSPFCSKSCVGWH